MGSGFTLLFEDDMCLVRDRKTNEVVAKSVMGRNKMFSIDLVKFTGRALAIKEDDETKLWHLRYGHLNAHNLKFLSSKNMVQSLPKIRDIRICEGCI